MSEIRPAVTAYSVLAAAGVGSAALRESLIRHTGGLTRFEDDAGSVDTFVGRIEAADEVRLPATLSDYDCRNNRLAEIALGLDGFSAAVGGAVRRYGADRIGVVLGTSTSGIAATEAAYIAWDGTGPLPDGFRYRETHELLSLTSYVRRRLGLGGPHYTISAACVSSTKTFVDAYQMLACGLCDAVVVGGIDSLCETSVRGFNSLQLLSPEPCRPNDAARKGICIGEGGGFALIERAEAATQGNILLAGYGESSDAHHMSAPHPDGLGARMAMDRALASAGLSPDAVDYINMHGTGSLQNDRAEMAAIAKVFGAGACCSSTKGWTGHALGAAGMVEAAICFLALTHGIAPGNLNLERLDAHARCAPLRRTEARPMATALTNNFGFGGNNCCLMFRDAGSA